MTKLNDTSLVTGTDGNQAVTGHDAKSRQWASKGVVPFVIVALLCFLAGLLGLVLEPVHAGNVAYLRGAGVAFALAIIFGRQIWPAIMVGLLLARTLLHQLYFPESTVLADLPSGFVVAAAATLQAILLAGFFERILGKPVRLKGRKDIVTMVVIVCLASGLLGSTVGTFVALQDGHIFHDNLLRTWALWWVGDILGAAIAVPMILLSPFRRQTAVFWKDEALPHFNWSSISLLLLSLFSTLAGWLSICALVERADNHSFNELVHDGQAYLEKSLDFFELALNGMVGFIYASQEVSADEWQIYLKNLNPDARLPELGDIGFVSAADMAFAVNDPAQTGETFELRNLFGDAGQSEFTQEPLGDSDAPQSGLDAQSVHSLFAALNEQQAAHKPLLLENALSGKDGHGYLLFLAVQKQEATNPVHETKGALVGWVYAPVFLDHLIVSTGDIFNLHTAFADSVATSDDSARLAEDISRAADRAPQYLKTTQLAAFGRNLTVAWGSTKSLEEKINLTSPAAILLLGLCFTLLLGVLLMSKARRQRLVEGLVADRTWELTETQHRLDIALTSANIGIFDVDRATNTSIVSPTWKTLLGFDASAEFDYQAEWLARVHPDDLPTVLENNDACLAGNITRSVSEYRLRTLDETVRWIRSEAVRVPNGPGRSGYRLIGVMLDISDLKRLDEAKQNFVATVSHELRTPLTSINGAITLLLSSMSDSFPENAVSLLKIANSNCGRLTRLVNDILDMQKNETGSFDFKYTEVDVCDLARDAVMSMQPFFDSKGVSADLQVHNTALVAHIDSHRCQQVLMNLLSNAAKFAFKGSTIMISVVPNGDNMRIAVSNHGEGIPVSFREKIFEPFAQADSSATRHNEGSGLGLTISRQIILNFSGTIDFESEPDGVTTFTVTLPLAKEARADERAT